MSMQANLLFLLVMLMIDNSVHEPTDSTNEAPDATDEEDSSTFQKAASERVKIHFHDEDADLQQESQQLETPDITKNVGGWWAGKSKKWDGYVFGAPTYKMGFQDMVTALSPKDGKWSAEDFMEEFSAYNHYLTEVHVVDYWKMPFFSKFNKRATGALEEDNSPIKGQVFWPQTVREKCLICRYLIAPQKQVGMFDRIFPDITDGAPNLYNANYLEAYQIDWVLKRCPIYMQDSCYRPDGFGLKLMSPCPDALLCSTCLGIPPSYCADFF